MEYYKYKVCVRCLTYNHAAYIEKALDGFCIQETNFPYVCTIIDDASNDGEQEILNKYLVENFDLGDNSVLRNEDTDDYSLIFAKHKDNVNCYFAVLFLKYNHYKKKDKLQYISEWINGAKYTALCEGDDYWTNSEKLQKQADALDTHSECVIAYCQAQMITKDDQIIRGRTIPRDNIFEEGIFELQDLLRKEFYDGYWVFHTSTFFFRTELTSGPQGRQEFISKFPYGDMPSQLWCLLHGKGYFLDIQGSRYRLQSGGYSSYVRTHSVFAVKQQEKLINALDYLDTITDRKYHKYLHMGILRASQRIDIRQGHAYYILKPKYWPLIKKMRFRTMIATVLQIISPRLHNQAKSLFLKSKYKAV